MSRNTFLLVISFILGVPDVSRARTVIVSGANYLPAATQLRTPFPCGTKILISKSGYHPQQADHINNPTLTNDYYALDLFYSKTTSFGKPVTSIGHGIVRYASWTQVTSGNLGYGYTVIVEHILSDGKTYQSLYAHLNEILVTVGQTVTPQTYIGRIGYSGLSGEFAKPSNAHLHFAMMQGATVNPPNSYNPAKGGVAVLPEPLDGWEDFRGNTIITAACTAQPTPAPEPEQAPTPEPTPSPGPEQGPRIPSDPDPSDTPPADEGDNDGSDSDYVANDTSNKGTSVSRNDPSVTGTCTMSSNVMSPDYVVFGCWLTGLFFVTVIKRRRRP